MWLGPEQFELIRPLPLSVLQKNGILDILGSFVRGPGNGISKHYSYIYIIAIFILQLTINETQREAAGVQSHAWLLSLS